ncbi:MAG TPA: two-component regulator propeller domain-containing protein [Acidisarcina sp.]
MLREGVFTIRSFRLRTFSSSLAVSCGCVLAVAFSFALSFFSGAEAQSPPSDHAEARGIVPQALVDPRIVRLPVVDRDDIRFRPLASTAGLSQTRVAQILQDDQGFLWFGTQNGLNRFDGYKCKVFRHDPDRPNSLSGAFIHSLFKDRSGALWAGTDQFLDRFDPTTETFKHFHVDAQDPIVMGISEDSAGLLWLATPNGLYRLEPTTGQITGYHHDPRDPSSLSSSDITSSGEDRTGTFWVVNNEGLDRFDRSTGKVTLHIPLHVTVREFSFHEDRQGVFWIIYGSGEGLAVFDRKTNRLTRYSFYEQPPPGTALTGVYAILEDHDGTMWFATMGVGVLKFDREHQRFIHYGKRPDEPESLAEDRVISLFEDREGNIWAGLHAKAPNYFSTMPQQFETIQLREGNPNNLGENLVNAIYQDREGMLWLGADGGLNRIDRTTGQHSFYQPAGPRVSTEVLTALDDRSGALWAGTLGDGLNRFDRRTGRFKTYRNNPTDPSTISSNVVPRLFIDHAGTMWAATWDGLDRFDAETDSFKVYKRDPQSKTESYFSIAEDRQGSLWLGSTSGLVRFDPSKAQFSVFKHNPDDPRSLSDNTVNSVYVDSSGTIWAGTQNGLDKFDPIADRFTVYYERDGLGGNSVSCILEDELSDLWMSSNKGLSRLYRKTKEFRSYSAADGLPGADLTGWGACFQGRNGEMFFGGFAGAFAFHPEQIRDSTYVPRVVLTDFRLSGAPVEVGPQSALKTSVNRMQDLTLSANQNNFSLEFSALSFLSPATNRYRYMLKGLDSSWHEVGSEERIASFTTLPAGTYEFRVQGATSRGPWGEPGATLRIVILPPWWGTWWFRSIYIVSAALLLAVLYSYRLRQVQRHFSIRLEGQIGERTRIARELHDTLLQGFQGLMLRFQIAADSMPRDERGRQIVEDAIARADLLLAEGRERIHDLRIESRGVTPLPDALAAVGRDLTHTSKLKFALICRGTMRGLRPVVREELYCIGREALVNAFLHSGGSVVEAEVIFAARAISIRVKDNGEGISPQILESNGREGHWGLSGMRERARTIGAQLNISGGSSSGTEVWCRVPARLAYEESASGALMAKLRRLTLGVRSKVEKKG